jgi:hypothetical protein
VTGFRSSDARSLQPPRPITLDVEPGRFRFSIWRNVTVTIWTDQALRDSAERVLRISRRLGKHFPGGRSTVTFICAGAPVPEPAAHDVFTELYRSNPTGISCMGFVLEGEGFWASRMRSLVTSLRIAAGSTMALRMNDNLEELLTWLPREHEHRTGERISYAEFAAMLQTARAEGTEPVYPTSRA